MICNKCIKKRYIPSSTSKGDCVICKEEFPCWVVPAYKVCGNCSSNHKDVCYACGEKINDQEVE